MIKQTREPIQSTESNTNNPEKKGIKVTRSIHNP